MGDWRSRNILIARQEELEALFLRLSSALSKYGQCDTQAQVYDYKQGSINLATPPQKFLENNPQRKFLALSADSGQVVSVSDVSTSSIQTGIAVNGSSQFAILNWDNFGPFITHALFAFSLGLGVNLYWIEGVEHPERKAGETLSYPQSPRSPLGRPVLGLSDLVRPGGLW